MHPAIKRESDIARLRSFGGRRVKICLSDASEHVGRVRTDLLSALSISLFLIDEAGEGATIYIEEIAAIWPIS